VIDSRDHSHRLLSFALRSKKGPCDQLQVADVVRSMACIAKISYFIHALPPFDDSNKQGWRIL